MRTLFFSMLFASACTVHGAAQPSASQAGRIPRAELEPREQLDGVIRHLSAQGYENVGKVLHNRHFAAPRTIVHHLDLPAKRCFVIVGLAPHTADLNLTVLAPNGRTVAHDMRRDSHPNVRFCTRVSGRYAVRLQMARGGGDYYLALFEGPQRVKPRVDTYFAGHEVRETAARAVRIDEATQARLGTLAERLEAEGYSSVGPAQGLSFGSARSREFRLNLRPDRCYVFATLAGPGVKEANATILTDEDEEIAQGEVEGSDSYVEFCPPEIADFSLRAQILAGRGPLVVAGFQKPVERDAAPADDQGEGPEGEVIAETSTESATLYETFALRSADLVARGYVSLGDPTREEIAQGGHGRHELTLEAGKCYAVLAVGGEGVAAMRLRAEGRDGGLLDQDLQGGRTAVVRFCPEATGPKSIVIAMQHGSGSVMVGAFAWPRGTRGPFGLEGVMYVRLAEMMQLLELEGYEPSVRYSPERGELDRVGTKATHAVSLEAGRCYALVAVGGEHITDLGLELVSGSRTLATAISRNAFPSVRHCADEDVEVELVVTARRGRGDYFVQVFERDPG